MILDEKDVPKSENGSTMSMSSFPPRAPLLTSYGQSYPSSSYSQSTTNVNEPLLPYAFNGGGQAPAFEQYPAGGIGGRVMGMVGGGRNTAKYRLLAILAGGSLLFLLHAHFFRPRGPLHPDRPFWGHGPPPFAPPPHHRPFDFEEAEMPPPAPPPLKKPPRPPPSEDWEEDPEPPKHPVPGQPFGVDKPSVEDFSDIPILPVEQFVQERREVPPTWPDPWEDSKSRHATLVRESLSVSRFGGDGDGAVGERGRKNPPEAALSSPPVKYLDKAMEWARHLVRTLDEFTIRAYKASGLVLNPLDGRPVPVPHSSIYFGGKTVQPPKLKINDVAKGKGVKEMDPVQWAGDRRERDGVSYIGRGESGKEREERRRAEWVKRAFLHSWEGYKKHAWGHDELLPTTDGFQDPFNGWGATIVDSLDTLLIMDLPHEYNLARNHVALIDFTYLIPRGKRTFSTKLPKMKDMDVPKTEEVLADEEAARQEALEQEQEGYEEEDKTFAASKLFDEDEDLALDDGPQGMSGEKAKKEKRQGRATLRADPEKDQHSPKTIPLFETTIRYLGGLLSAYDLSGDPLMLQRAVELGDLLLPSMSTKHGLAQGHYVLGSNPKGLAVGRSVLAEVGSLTLEFTRLSMLTGDDVYFRAVQRAMDTLDTGFALAEKSFDTKSARRRLGTLLPAYVDPGQPKSVTGDFTFGGLADSYYEYLIKQHQLLGGSTGQFSKMYSEAIDSAHEHLIRRVSVVPGRDDLTVIGTVKWGRYSYDLEHLTCFAGGMLGLGAKLLNREKDMETAKNVTEACIWAYESSVTGVGPESLVFYEPDDPSRYVVVTSADGTKARKPRGTPVGVKVANSRYLGRPETIESVLYMYRLTGDRKWQDQGWLMFTRWIETAITDSGIGSISNVHFNPIKLENSMESFVLAETFKYYYLLFSPTSLISLDDWVFNTEAHPFRVAKAEPKKPDYEKFWTKDHAADAEKLMFQSATGLKAEMGQGTPVQQWARVQQAASQIQTAKEALLKGTSPLKPPPKFVRPSEPELDEANTKDRLRVAAQREAATKQRIAAEKEQKAAALLADKQVAAQAAAERIEIEEAASGGRPKLKDVIGAKVGEGVMVGDDE